jgi:hypothetical protein
MGSDIGLYVFPGATITNSLFAPGA